MTSKAGDGKTNGLRFNARDLGKFLMSFGPRWMVGVSGWLDSGGSSRARQDNRNATSTRCGGGQPVSEVGGEGNEHNAMGGAMGLHR